MKDAEHILQLRRPTPRPILAVGGDLKNTIAVIHNEHAFISPVHGDLADAQTYRQFLGRLRDWASRLGDNLGVICDRHPGYLSVAAARAMFGDPFSVQHHHAHLVACLAEHEVEGPAVGVICDGTGYGIDEAIWGGEVLLGAAGGFERVCHIGNFRIPGGDAAARQTWRPALALIEQAYEGAPPPPVEAMFSRIAPAELAGVRAMLRSGVNSPFSSSLGRVFDAVAFLVGCCDSNDVEGQAPIRLEQLARQFRESRPAPPPPYPFSITVNGAGPHVALESTVRAICEDLACGVSPAAVAARFHATLIWAFAEVAAATAQDRGIETVVLSGGCFLNQELSNGLSAQLLGRGVRHVLRHGKLSPGDASLSLGQAMAGSVQLGRTGP